MQWISFGGDSVIAENVRDEQRKFIKYNHLVANILAFHNIVSMTKAIDRLKTTPLDVRLRTQPSRPRSATRTKLKARD